MNLADKKVRHRQFGDGIVTDQSTSRITVQFSEEYGEKKFLYPFAFEAFLTLDSPMLKGKMDAKLRDMREQEAKQRQDEKRRTLFEQKYAAVKKRASAKKSSSKPKAHTNSSEPAGIGDEK